ncbi:MAG: ArdC-like ssDNA-binding domain-containing protein [Bacilli bacterium]
MREYNFEKYSKMTYEEKKNLNKSLYKDLTDRVNSFSENVDSYKEALIDYGSFDNYSMYNRMLLRDQLKMKNKMYEVPVFKTFNEWKKEDVMLKKGSKSYAIITPIKVEKYKEGNNWVNITSKNRDMVKENNYDTKIFTNFQLKNCAFHISDTNATQKILDIGQSNYYTIDKNNEESLKNFYESIKRAIDGKYRIVENKNMLPNIGGSCTKAPREGYVIELNSNSTSAMKINTLFHEIAHVELDHLDSRNSIDNNTKELEAESTAFLFSSKFGIDTEISFKYLNGYGGETKSLNSIFNNVFNATQKIEDKFMASIVENINERDVNQNQVIDINEENTLFEM